MIENKQCTNQLHPYSLGMNDGTFSNFVCSINRSQSAAVWYTASAASALWFLLTSGEKSRHLNSETQSVAILTESRGLSILRHPGSVFLAYAEKILALNRRSQTGPWCRLLTLCTFRIGALKSCYESLATNSHKISRKHNSPNVELQFKTGTVASTTRKTSSASIIRSPVTR